MFVRKPKIKMTVIDSKFDQILKKKKIIKNVKYGKVNFSVLNIPLTFKNLCNQIRKRSDLISYI